MKKLEDFTTEKVELKNIFGGEWVQTDLGSKKDANGCTVTTTDSFDDKNGDKKLSAGESYTSCTSVSC